MDETPQEKLAKMMFGTSLESWVKSHRDAGMSWDRISRQLAAQTEDAVEYTGETLRRKYS